jgi:hypothetical protein
MKNPQNKKNNERLWDELECFPSLTPAELNATANLNHDALAQYPELASWLQEDDRNREYLESRMRFDQALGRCLQETSGSQMSPEEQIANRVARNHRIKILLASKVREWAVSPTDEINSQSEGRTELEELEKADYPMLFALDDSNKPSTVKDNPQEVSTAEATIASRSRRKLIWSTAVSGLIVAASVAMLVYLRPTMVPQPQQITAEILGNQALAWNPVGQPGWIMGMENAPIDRRFPGHLIKFQARSWRKMKIAGDNQAVVYNLIADDDLSSLQAYLYVFRGGDHFELPSQFDSIPDANLDYRFWSVVCQENLVYVLVFEGDQNRVLDLVKQQKVG